MIDDSTAFTLLEFVEKHKRDLSDGAYLQLCNASKYMYDQVKRSDDRDELSSWFHDQDSDTWWPENESAPHYIRNPFWRKGPDWGMSYVPAFTNIQFQPSAHNVEIMRLEKENNDRKRAITENEKIMRNKKRRVSLSDKYHVLYRIFTENQLIHHIPYNVKSMKDKVSYYEDDLKTHYSNIFGLLSKEYENESISRIAFRNERMLEDNKRCEEAIKANLVILAGLRS